MRHWGFDMRCPRCLSSNIEVYKVKAWKCNDCGAIFVTPAPDAITGTGDGSTAAIYDQTATTADTSKS